MNKTTAIYWMVRAGEGGFRFEDFQSQSLVTIGWHEMGDLNALRHRADFQKAAAAAYPNLSTGTLSSYAGQTFRFVREMKVGDNVVTYNPSERIYLLGTVAGDYAHAGTAQGDHPNRRLVQWRGTIARDGLSVAARASLGSISTLFQIPLEVGQELEKLVAQPAGTLASPAVPLDVTTDEVGSQYKDIQNQALEFIKDRVSALDWAEMQELVAGLLRAMGYKTRVSPSGSDRGKDIVASRDGLGFEDPRIVVEVKHHKDAIGSPQIRSFLGGPHERDKGLYVSTGGFTKDARYEAERGRIPIALMDLDDLVKALLEHYEQADSQTQRLVPLRKLYWPA
ncbi:restriction endonuclease [Acidovorax sp. SUPP1855]|uniref:restriction endonuclease n=1 Tax=Acidovorax sp. SUPP1855 TaxID=431774 RepID=UPI0023DE1E69|nr:restriction endonuclease [Acidovorax sp. SUPP1855]GKS83089.1 restriction endonuclease [Acidovorax sp. SUPP1855]